MTLYNREAHAHHAGYLAGQRERAREVEVLTAERDAARAHRDRLADILTRIHACLAPPDVTAPDGRVWSYVGPDMPEMLRMLGDRIRAIPDELTAAAVAATEGHSQDS